MNVTDELIDKLAKLSRLKFENNEKAEIRRNKILEKIFPKPISDY